MNTAVIYATKTGHCRKIASAVANAIGTKAMDISTNPEINNIDLLFVVGGIYGGKSAPELLEYVGKLQKEHIKKAVLITSSVSQSAKSEELLCVLTAQGIEVAEEFKCRGAFLFVGLGHPNNNDIEETVAFAKKQIA